MRWLASLVPRPVAAAPEQVLINTCCVIIGLSAIVLERPGSLLSLWPDGFAYAWALGMAAGGAAALAGLWHRYRALPGPVDQANALERVGYLAILGASLAYGVALLVTFGWRGAASAVIFLGIAGAKTVRLLTSSAARGYLLRTGREPGDET